MCPCDTRKGFTQKMKVTFKFETPTDSQKAKKLLISNGISVTPIKLLSDEKSGCANGLSIPYFDYLKAVELLKVKGISYTVREMK